MLPQFWLGVIIQLEPGWCKMAGFIWDPPLDFAEAAMRNDCCLACIGRRCWWIEDGGTIVDCMTSRSDMVRGAYTFFKYRRRVFRNNKQNPVKETIQSTPPFFFLHEELSYKLQMKKFHVQGTQQRMLTWNLTLNPLTTVKTTIQTKENSCSK